jgi:hypothetical protein
MFEKLSILADKAPQVTQGFITLIADAKTGPAELPLEAVQASIYFCYTNVP